MPLVPVQVIIRTDMISQNIIRNNENNKSNDNNNKNKIINIAKIIKNKTIKFFLKHKKKKKSSIVDDTDVTVSSDISNIEDSTSIPIKFHKTQLKVIQSVDDTRNQLLKNEDERMITWGEYPKEKSECRILFQNTNGISPSSKFAKAHMISMEAVTKSVDILCLAECNLDWKHKNTENTCTTIFKKYWTQTKISCNNSTERFGKMYQPGGVCMIVGEKWANQSKPGQDNSGLGRWTETIITGRNNKKVVIITAYNVCKNNISSAGSNTAYFQQWHILHRQKKYDTICPRKIMLQDLQNHITEL